MDQGIFRKIAQGVSYDASEFQPQPGLLEFIPSLGLRNVGLNSGPNNNFIIHEPIRLFMRATNSFNGIADCGSRSCSAILASTSAT